MLLGIHLERVYLDYDGGIWGGKGGGVLHIFAYGSDALINHEPEKEPKETIIWIERVDKTELDFPYEFEINSEDDNRFDPYQEDINILSDAARLGIIKSMISCLGDHYSQLKEKGSIGLNLDYKYPNSMQINTKVYIEQLFKALERRRINTKTKRAKKYLIGLNNYVNHCSTFKACPQKILVLYMYTVTKQLIFYVEKIRLLPLHTIVKNSIKHKMNVLMRLGSHYVNISVMSPQIPTWEMQNIV